MPATTLLIALHNMVSETIDDSFQPNGRKHFYCPGKVVKQLKEGLLAEDSEVATYQLPENFLVEGVPGLGAQLDSYGLTCA